MGRTVQVIRDMKDSFWIEVASASAEATFFHTPYWRDLAVGTDPDTADASIGARLEDGTCVVLPLLETGRSARGLMRHLLSTFGGCYGGVISDAPIPPARRARVYAALLTRLRVDSLQVTGNPLESEAGVPDRFEARPYATHLLDLDAGWEAVQRRFSRGNRASINRGKRAGTTTRTAESLDDYRAYYSIYEASLQRWGDRATSRYPWRLFEVGRELALRSPGAMRLWLAEAEGRVLAGAWVFTWNRHAVYWHGATDVASSALRPANVLHADIIRHACEAGMRWYDFNPSGGHEGVARFKSSFGASLHPIQVWTYRSRPAEVLGSVRRLLQ